MLDTFYLHPFQPTLYFLQWLIFKGSTLGYLTAPPKEIYVEAFVRRP